MGQKVKIYLVRFVDDGGVLWMRQSYDFALANAICKRLATQGKKPVLFKVCVCPASLVSSNPSRSRRYVAA